MNFADFVAANKISADVSPVDRNPNMDDSQSMDNWRVTLKGMGRKMTIYFSKGRGHHGAEPTADEVLECLTMDASGDLGSFESWCADYGYDTDSRKAHRTFTVCKRRAKRLQKFMGSEFDALMQCEA